MSEGKTGDDKLEDSEEKLDFYDFDVTLGQIRHAVRSAGKLSDKRPAFDMKQQAKPALGEWAMHKVDNYTLAALSGLASADANVSANAPSTGRKWVGGQTIGTTGIGTLHHVETNLDAEFTATSTDHLFGPQVIAAVKRKAIMTEPIIRPIIVDGQERYVMFIHPYQAKALRSDWEWINSHCEADVRGQKNAIFTGALGMYDGVILHMWPKVEARLGAGGSTPSEYFDSGDDLDSTVYAARALFCGAQAVVQAYGKLPSYEADTFDYGNQWGVAIGMQITVDKVEFDSKDLGVMAVDTEIEPD